MWDERAERARRDIAALAAAGLGVAELHAQVAGMVQRTVQADLACWAAIDPEMLVISTMVSGENRLPAEYEAPLAAAEYSQADEPHRFAALAARRQPVARFSDLPRQQRQRSARLVDVWRPLGLDRELRGVFLADGACWGAAGMVRTGRDFSDREVDFLTALAPALGSATRLAVRAHHQRDPLPRRPAIVVVGPDGELRTMTAAAREWREVLDEPAPGRFALMMAVMAGGAHAAHGDTFRARVQDRDGQWVLLQASPLLGEDAQTAVVLERATGHEVVGLLLAAYALTSRERDICREVIAGHSTADIAARLFISAHTVQDHLKSVFTKVEVRSRGELVARLQPAGAG